MKQVVQSLESQYARRRNKVVSVDGVELDIKDIYFLDNVSDDYGSTYIEIVVLDNTENKLEEIQRFLNSDISTIKFEYDICMNDETERVLDHTVQVFERYNNNINISYGRLETKGYNTRDEYIITMMKHNSATELADSNNNDMITIYEAIVDTYESVV